jgi:hypothetical protein
LEAINAFIGTIFAISMMLAFGSVYSVIYTRSFPLSNKYKIKGNVDIKSMSPDMLDKLRLQMIKSSGVNEHHA